jgi:hypothetical protein
MAFILNLFTESNNEGLKTMPNRKRTIQRISCQKGSALPIAMMVMVLLTFVGLFSLQSTGLELMISGNERLYQKAFMRADGGTETGVEVLEENLYLRGFPSTQVDDVFIVTQNLYLNTGLSSKPGPGNRDAFYTPPNSPPGSPDQTNIRMGGNTSLSSGGAIQMIAGYEGKGKGAAAGGVWITYDVRAQHQGFNSSEAVVNIRWRHVL